MAGVITAAVAGMSTGAMIAGAMVVSAGMSYYEGKKARKAAEAQHRETMRAQEQAEEEALARDRARAMEQVEAKGATTKYGKKKTPAMSASEDLLIAPKPTGLGGISRRTGLGF